jgi:hypothetical protein
MTAVCRDPFASARMAAVIDRRYRNRACSVTRTSYPRPEVTELMGLTDFPAKKFTARQALDEFVKG